MFFRAGARSWVETCTSFAAILVLLVTLTFSLLSLCTNLPAAAQTSSGARDNSSSGNALKPIIVDYPDEKSIFPPDMAPPTFLWRDTAEDTTAWQIDIVFADGSPEVQATSRGEHFQIGEIDEHCIAPSNERPALTPQLAASRTWIPDDEMWASLKRHAVKFP